MDKLFIEKKRGIRKEVGFATNRLQCSCPEEQTNLLTAQHSQWRLHPTLGNLCPPLPVGHFCAVTSHPILNHHFTEKKQSHLSFLHLFTFWSILAFSTICIVQWGVSIHLPVFTSVSSYVVSLFFSYSFVPFKDVHTSLPSPSPVGHWCVNKPPPLLAVVLLFSPLTVTPSVSIYHHFPTCLTSVTESFFFVAIWEFHYQCQTY